MSNDLFSAEYQCVTRQVRMVHGAFNKSISAYVLHGRNICYDKIDGIDRIAYIAARSAHMDVTGAREAGIACVVCGFDGSLLYTLEWRTDVLNISRGVILGCQSVARRNAHIRIEMHVADCSVIDTLSGEQTIFSVPNGDMKAKWAQYLTKKDLEVVFVGHNDYHSDVRMRDAFARACEQVGRRPYWEDETMGEHL